MRSPTRVQRRRLPCPRRISVSKPLCRPISKQSPTFQFSRIDARRSFHRGSSNGMAILEKPVRQYAGQLDAQLLVKWVAAVKLLSRIPILKGAFMMTVTTQPEESTAAGGDRLLM